MTYSRIAMAIGLLLNCLLFDEAIAEKYNQNSYIGRTPPELTAKLEHWLGWDQPVTLRGLRGKVVWLQFNF